MKNKKNNSSSFKAAEIAKRFNVALEKLDKLLENPNTQDVKTKLHQDLKQHQDQGFLTVAFIGQYSAGKSTIISALTGRHDIKIDADISTDKTSAYDWNGIKLIDTPGLFTDRKDHDEITYNAINKADLLVFCLTYALFDTITVENFEKLAYTQGYKWKMMLVINKMSDEAGEEAEKIANYSQSLADALKPYSLDEFPLAFIDAKDYCEGSDQNDEFLLEISRFPTFIEALNNFVEKRGSLAQFDTPVRIGLSSLDEAELIFSRDSKEDAGFFEIFNQLSRKVRKERNNLRTKVKNIALKMSAAVVTEGTNLAQAVGTQEFESLNKNSEINVQTHWEKAEDELQTIFDEAVEDIQQEIKEVFESNLVLQFFTYLENNCEIDSKNVSEGLNTNGIKSSVDSLASIAAVAGIKLTNLATRSFLNTAPASGFLRSIDVFGSELHQGVIGVGKFVGFKFKPWQAVNIAKNIGNYAKFLGPALSIVALCLEVLSIQKEQQREKEMADVRRNITSSFQTLAKDLENQINIQLDDFEHKVYGKIEEQISLARQQREKAMAASKTWVKQLADIRKDFELILADISRYSCE